MSLGLKTAQLTAGNSGRKLTSEETAEIFATCHLTNASNKSIRDHVLAKKPEIKSLSESRISEIRNFKDWVNADSTVRDAFTKLVDSYTRQEYNITLVKMSGRTPKFAKVTA